jgi:U3 small nucleolar RNA-associated protein 14
MRDEDISATETLKMNHLLPEEVQARRAELRRMRELTFRAEAKAKRVAKIKSKTFRRLRKKEKARLAEKLGEGEDEDEEGEEGRMKREVERAKERATLRHKNTGKWARAMARRGEMDDEQRKEVGEMLDRGEKLRRRIRGELSGDEEQSESEEELEDEEGVRAAAFEELRRVREEEVGGEAAEKGVFKMKFMRDAMARDMARAEREADDFAREIGSGIPEDEDEETMEIPAAGLAQVQRMGGRVSFQPGATVRACDLSITQLLTNCSLVYRQE